MTAKEMAELAKQIVSVNRGERGNEYVFSYGLFKDFINQLCKEQRENCSQSITFVGLQSSINVDYYTVNREQIRNAKQPEV